LTILNSTIAGNIASTSNQASGGGIYTYTGTLAVNNSTIVDNMSSYVGGGIFGAATIGNSILSGNVANDSASECYYGTLTSQGNNIIGNTTGCTVSSLGSDKLNVDPDAFFIRDLGVAVLSHSSPAVDAGNPITCLAVDQRGVARSYDGDENGTAICDIGAFEYSGAGSTISFLLPIQSGRHYIKMENEDPLRFAVIAFDSLGNIVPGAMITFTAPTTGTSGTFGDSGNHATTAQTDGGGTATSARFTANTLPGIYTVQVTAAGAGTPIIFNMINGVGISIYSMNHQEEPPSSLPGSFVCDESQPGCTGGADLDADHAQTFAMDTYAFFIQHHGRNSLDGGGIPITASVHYGTNYDNAFWDDAQAVFGDDYVTDDIVAHELTHGVTEYTSGLLYYYQSGAISESFSDLWGEFVDLTNGPAGVSPSEKWLIGEDIGAFRNMANPPQFNDPDRMTSFYYHLGDLEDLVYVPFDNGGVHTNSGVNNKAVSLMTDGGSFNGYSVASLGIDKVAAIYYETQIHLLTSGAGYRDLYYAVHQACLNLIGSADGITLDDCGEVQKALESVEMNIDPITDFAPTASVCPNNAQPNNLFYDDFESGTGKWVLPAEWGVDSLYAASGQYSLYGLDSNVMTDTRATMSSSVAVPASGTTYLHFKQAFGFEINPDSGIIFRTWDGGVLEYQIDGGAWQDAGVLLDSGRGYNGQIYTGGGTNNPLAGRNAFVSDSHGYVSSRYNLGISAIRGHSIRFRWRIGTDQNTGELGWEIDDVRIYTCRITSPGTLLFLDDFSTAKGWTDNTLGGDVVRNATSQRLEWTARQSRALHYTIPIYATNDPIQLDFRFRVNSTQDTSLLWVGLANELNDLSPSVAGADLAGTFVGIDTSNKIQLMSLYPDRSYTQVDSAASTLTYNGQVTWQRAILTITGTDWTMVLKDDTGAEMGEMSGTLPRQQDHYDYLVLMYDSGTGDGFEGGYLDDIYVYGTARTSTFSDVPYGFWAHDWIERLFSAGITGGCGGGNYCPEQSVTRGQMAVFLERGMNSSSYTPPAETGTVFGDVPTSYWSASWVEKLFADGITGGCGGGNYCPDLAVSRAQMAVFLLRAKHGSSYTPPPATGVFPDVPTSYWAASWIEQLYAESITGGCGGGNYCPDQSVTRDQMAVFLVRTFNLP
jgi:hypothetical protein